MFIEQILPTLRTGGVVFDGAYPYKLEDEKFWATTLDGRWIEVPVDVHMLTCDKWNLHGGPDWKAHT
jgi:hypothetical protein